MVAVLVAVCMFSASTCLAQPTPKPSPNQKDSLERFLRNYLRDPGFPEHKTTEYFSAFVDLRDDGTKEAIVYLLNGGWCGTGGCTTVILTPEGSSYRVITKISIAWPPIRLLATKSHGWHDLGVWVQGGGTQPGYEARLSFDGKRYPFNPSTPPAKRIAGRVAGKVVVSQTVEGTPLY